jgi:hypothetical protein
VTLVRDSPDRKAVRKPEILLDIHGFCQSNPIGFFKKIVLSGFPQVSCPSTGFYGLISAAAAAAAPTNPRAG